MLIAAQLMTKEHGNRAHYQVLLSPGLAALLDREAASRGMRSSALLREWAYQGLRQCCDATAYRLAEAQDVAMRRQGIQNQVAGRRAQRLRQF